jgi:hypothetical protein
MGGLKSPPRTRHEQRVKIPTRPVPTGEKMRPMPGPIGVGTRRVPGTRPRIAILVGPSWAGFSRPEITGFIFGPARTRPCPKMLKSNIIQLVLVPCNRLETRPLDYIKGGQGT